MDSTCSGSTSRKTLENFLQTLKQWQITIIMLFTMTFQLVLVLSGFFRKRTSHPLFHSLIWISFIGLDALSAYAIGLMLAGGCDHVFSLWAPILLFHLGASDSINAFSPSDNELWRRHSLKMTLEIIGAAYILSRAGNCTKFLGTAALIFIIGSFKYLERVHALWCGSANQVVRCSRSVYRFMASDHGDGHASEMDENHIHRLVVSGEASWYKQNKLRRPNFNAGNSSLVTYDDVVQCRELRMAARYINDVCLAFALFKIYRRRLTNLRIHHKDEDYEKVKRVFFPRGRAEPSPLRIMKVIDMELSFIFDGTFTKGAAGGWFQGIGIATRGLSILLLFVCAVDLLAGDVAKIACEGGSDGSTSTANVHLAGAMTILLVIVSFGVECLQAYKMVRSNWTRVWLACSYITEKRRALSRTNNDYVTAFHEFNVRLLKGAFWYVGDPSKQKCWHERIGQRSVVVDGMAALSAPWMWNWMTSLDMNLMMQMRKKRSEILHIVDVNASDVHYNLFEKMARKFTDITVENLASKRDVIARSVRFPFGGQESQIGPEFSASSDSGLEEAVLSWHLATSVCEMDLLLSGRGSAVRIEMEAVKMSVALSRYCLYLLVDSTGLTPADPDLCKPLYDGLVRKLGGAFRRHPETIEMTMVKDFDISSLVVAEEEDEAVSGILVSGIGLGRRILEKWPDAERRWSLLMEVWVDIIIYIAIAENAHPHAEQLAKGGELLSHLWVLLGHLGFGQKSWISKPHN